MIGAEYRGLRDVDGWQRRDPWGGSAGDAPNRSSTRTFISTPTSLSPIYTPSFTGPSEASALTESGKVPPSIDEPGKGETQKSILAMSEEELVALEERAKKIGGTGESPFVHRSPFAPSSLSLSPHIFIISDLIICFTCSSRHRLEIFWS